MVPTVITLLIGQADALRAGSSNSGAVSITLSDADVAGLTQRQRDALARSAEVNALEFGAPAFPRYHSNPLAPRKADRALVPANVATPETRIATLATLLDDRATEYEEREREEHEATTRRRVQTTEELQRLLARTDGAVTPYDLQRASQVLGVGDPLTLAVRERLLAEQERCEREHIEERKQREEEQARQQREKTERRQRELAGRRACVVRFGTPEQVERFDADMLPAAELRKCLRHHAFAPLFDMPKPPKLSPSDIRVDDYSDGCNHDRAEYGTDTLDNMPKVTSEAFVQYKRVVKALEEIDKIDGVEARLEFIEHVAACSDCDAEYRRLGIRVEAQVYGIEVTREVDLGGSAALK